MNPHEWKDLPEFRIEISPGSPRWSEDLTSSEARALMRRTAAVRKLAHLWLCGLLSHACLDDMSEAELVSIRTYTKNRTFEVRLVNDKTGRRAAQRLDELTAYMRRRFPRRRSTPPCEAVCV